jgi:hypothetical protein
VAPRFTQPPALGRKAGDEFSLETRKRQLMVIHICEPMPSTGPLLEDGGKTPLTFNRHTSATNEISIQFCYLFRGS